MSNVGKPLWVLLAGSVQQCMMGFSATLKKTKPISSVEVDCGDFEDLYRYASICFRANAPEWHFWFEMASSSKSKMAAKKSF